MINWKFRKVFLNKLKYVWALFRKTCSKQLFFYLNDDWRLMTQNFNDFDESLTVFPVVLCRMINWFLTLILRNIIVLHVLIKIQHFLRKHKCKMHFLLFSWLQWSRYMQPNVITSLHYVTKKYFVVNFGDFWRFTQFCELIWEFDQIRYKNFLRLLNCSV